MKKNITKYPLAITTSFIKTLFDSYILYQSIYFRIIGNTDLIVWLEIGMQLRIDYDTIFLQWHSVLSIGYSSNLKNCWCH